MSGAPEIFSTRENVHFPSRNPEAPVAQFGAPPQHSNVPLQVLVAKERRALSRIWGERWCQENPDKCEELLDRIVQERQELAVGRELRGVGLALMFCPRGSVLRVCCWG